MTQVHAQIPAADAGPAFAKRLDEIGWAVLLIVTGVIWLFPESQIPPGTWFIAVGILLLGLNAIRAMARVPVSGFTTLFGALALAGGLATLWGVELPIVALGLILFGLGLLYRQLIST
jgi:hypothetical protein